MKSIEAFATGLPSDVFSTTFSADGLAWVQVVGGAEVDDFDVFWLEELQAASTKTGAVSRAAAAVVRFNMNTLIPGTTSV
ncbi:hypothetical protein MTY66_60070 [Mycolicibacterium sp. TY66]|nr:hypothetical protein MTY66_60070 [Mycolicibacterium sp. TY66]BCJ83996.1 hypothetical protein MTY81_53690 [Mycolicibacterium sp. TY81]